MVDNPSDPIYRLSIIRDAKTRVKPRDEENATGMAQICGMTVPAFMKFVKQQPSMPILEVGTNGRSFRFNVKKALTFMEKHYQSKIDRDAVRKNRIAELSGVSGHMDDNYGSEITPSDLERIMKVHLQAHKLAEQQRRFIVREDAEKIWREVLNRMMSTIIGFPAAVDPNGQLEPDVRMQIGKLCRTLALSIQEELEETLNGRASVASRNRAVN